VVARRAVCAAPRGLAYDAATDLVHVACAGGELVSLPAGGGAAVRSLLLDRDLRDVVVAGDKLRVSRFRSAQILTVDATGAVAGRLSLPVFRSALTRGGQTFSPAIAWKMEATSADGGVVMVHQRGVDDEIQPTTGGYGGQSPCDAIVQTAITTVTPSGQVASGPAIVGFVVPTDIAVSPDGQRVAVVSAGNATNAETEGAPPRMPRVFVTDMTSATDGTVGCAADGTHGPCIPQFGFLESGGPAIPNGPDGGAGSIGTTGAGGSTTPDGVGGTSGQMFPAVDGGAGSVGGTGGGSVGGAGGDGTVVTGVQTTCGFVPDNTPTDPTLPSVVGQAIAVAFTGGGQVIVQSREPAVLSLPDGGTIVLSSDSREDTGHTLFHANSGGGIACASCHAEGNDDGRVWSFACEGPRRTQSLQTGLAGTEPFHWDGNEHDFPQLVVDVFTGRMSGPRLSSNQTTATLLWLDAQPRPHESPPVDPNAVTRGQALFNDNTRAACAVCHAGVHMTNNATVDVGTGGAFQVPSLIGLGMRGPYMHNGCAATLADRFGPCGGGDHHGGASLLSAGELSDLVAYLQSL
jgi:hypothetical protein